MKIEDLIYFLEIEKTKSISNAAKRLFISQQGLSKALQCLESELNVTLFNRNSKSLTLTAEGKLFTESAQKIIDEYEKLCLKISTNILQDKSLDIIEYKINATPYILNYLIDNIYHLIYSSYPNLNVGFYEKSPEEIMNSLATNTTNTLCITNIPSYIYDSFIKRTDTVLFFKTIFQATLMAKVSSSSVLAKKKVLLPQEIKQYPIAIISDDMMVDMVANLLNDDNLSNVVIKTFNRKIINHKILNEEAIGFSDTYLVKNPDPRFTIIPIQNSVTMHVGLIYNRNNPPSNSALDLADFIVKIFPAT